MRVVDLYRHSSGPLFSVELIPPRNGGDIADIYSGVEALLPEQPAYFSVTHGSGGSLRGGTFAIVHNIQQKYGVVGVAHLTCVDSTVKDIENELMNLTYLGIENVLALRGDPPWGETVFKPVPDGHAHASDLVSQIRDMNRGRYLLRANDREFLKLPPDAQWKEGKPTAFCIGVAGYPENHVESQSVEADIAHQKTKMDAGAEYILTQMIFDAEYYKAYVRNCRQAGITQPIIPGLFPPTTEGKIRMAETAFKATVPPGMKDFILANAEKKSIEEAGIEATVRLGLELLAAGAPGLHFYSMNNGALIARILREIKGRQ